MSLRTLAFLLVLPLATACNCGGDPGTGDGGTDGGGDAGTDLAPEVTITAPSAGSSFEAGTTIDFSGSATDAEDGALTGNALAWSSDVEGQLGIGATISNALSTLGAHVITLTATDSAGNSTSATVSITVTPAAPTAVIDSPTDSASFWSGEVITFSATITPSGSATVADTDIVWSSDVDGDLGTGNPLMAAPTSTGAHVITLTVTDSLGLSATATVSITVDANVAPTATITAPNDGAFYKTGDTVDFLGTGDDPEDGPLTTTSLVWTSDLDGNIGTDVGPSFGLSTGTHVITLTATDSAGATGTDSITVNVVDNVPPVCTITSHTDGDRVLTGTTLDFVGTCTDREDGAVTNGLTWTSDLDGDLGDGTAQTPSTGEHTITFCAVDPSDSSLTGCTSITFLVADNEPPVCVIDAPSDGAVVPPGTVNYDATVTDIEDPAITGNNVTYSWSDGTAEVATTEDTTHDYVVGDVGTHTWTLTATDSLGATCSASVTVRIDQPPTASIASMDQGGNTTPPFFDGADVDFVGAATDPDGDGTTLDWLDNLAGPFGTGNTAALTSPMVGNHLVTLTATDDWGLTGTDTVSFTVLPVGATSLADTYAANFQGLAGGDNVESMVVTTGDVVWAGVDNQPEVLSFDGTDETDTATVVMDNTQSPDDVRHLWIDETGGRIYISTKAGYAVCGWDATNGIDTASCATFIGGDLPNNDIRGGVVMVTGSDGNDYLVIGTTDGVLVTDVLNGASTGTTGLVGTDLRALAAGDGVVWGATQGGGLVRIDPVTGDDQAWTTTEGAPHDNLRDLALSSDGAHVWVGTDSGLGRFNIAGETWKIWRVGDAPAPGLVHDTVREVVVQAVDIGGTVRDVVWCGTDGGVSRFDTLIPSFMSLTTADGLPHNRVRSIAILSDGTKLFGTDTGVARYTGP